MGQQLDLGLTVAQISEFSIIFIAMGLSLGHVSDRVLGLVTLVGIITITTSTYMIMYSQQLFDRVKHLLGPFERAITYREIQLEEPVTRRPVILFGLGRFGRRLAAQLRENRDYVIGVDIDPARYAKSTRS